LRGWLSNDSQPAKGERQARQDPSRALATGCN
jgi:hypothetical protein